MIDEALHIVSEQLNQFLKLRFDLTENMVTLSYVVNQDGSVAKDEKNKIIFSLLDISEEVYTNGSGQYRNTPNGEYIARPNMHLNLQVGFFAYFNPSNYNEALKFVSAVIQFFHSKPAFTQQNTPILSDRGIEKLQFEMVHLDSNTKNNLWATLGAKYMPSVVYRVRAVLVEDASAQGYLETIRTMEIDMEIQQSNQTRKSS
ncbi:MAG: DUF4255 domain-containing protein [bacterium]|nr:DUF4255 domain-containing protein [bacterium]